MSLFNVSGFGDWDTTDAGETLCENFKKDTKINRRKKKGGVGRKVRNASSKATKSLERVVKSCNNKVKLLTKTKLNKLSQKQSSDDQVVLISSVNSTANENHKKGKKRKKKLKQKLNSAVPEPDSVTIHPAETASMSNTIKKRKKQLQQLKQMIEEQPNRTITRKENERNLTLRQKMMKKLKAARFRYLNEQIYTTTGKETEKIFRQYPESFKAYHEGYKLQVKQWPVNPLDKIVASISKMNKNLVIADFGCGEAKLANSVPQTVHSFDLVSANDSVIACDMAHVPLNNASADVVVFCLSLMGTNLKDYLIEANRVLKKGGLVKIAEVESRFEDVNSFIKSCECYGFKNTWKDMSYNLFYFMDFKKVGDVVAVRKKLPMITLQPCLYKKR